MARKLPWATRDVVSSASPKVERATPATSKREAGQDVSKPSSPQPSPRRPRRHAKSRDPSTSPIQPPAQPNPQVEPMRPGLSQDDRYIMVEDEFEAVARQFTAHLHAAEYARLKAKARSAPPRALPSPTSGLPASSKLGLERRHLKSRQDSALMSLKKRPRGQDSDGGEDSEADDAQAYNPWGGTSLAGLMDSGEKTKTSLIGLERIDSRTRAARGFERGNSQLEGMTREAKKPTIGDIFAPSGRRHDDDDDNDNDNGDTSKSASARDVRQQHTGPSTATTGTTTSTKPTTRLLPTSIQSPSKSPVESSNRNSGTKHRPTKRFDFDDGFDDS